MAAVITDLAPIVIALPFRAPVPVAWTFFPFGPILRVASHYPLKPPHLPAEEPAARKNRCADDKEREDPADAGQAHGFDALIVDISEKIAHGISSPPPHLSFEHVHAKRKVRPSKCQGLAYPRGTATLAFSHLWRLHGLGVSTNLNVKEYSMMTKDLVASALALAFTSSLLAQLALAQSSAARAPTATRATRAMLHANATQGGERLRKQGATWDLRMHGIG